MFPSIGQFFARLFHKLFPPETQGCHYINGPETLPPPLTKEEEAQVLENIRQGVPGAREPLITHNLRLVVYIAKKIRKPRRQCGGFDLHWHHWAHQGGEHLPGGAQHQAGHLRQPVH